MREIKFRAWLGDRMLTPYFMFETSKRTGELNSVFYGGQVPKELMQYTGLKDKNGVEIYEGDILGCADSYYGGCNIIVEFVLNDKTNGYIISNEDVEHIEVIGNIHQNPELLK